METSEKARQPADKDGLEQTKRTKERLVRKPRKTQGKTASKHREDKKAAITSLASMENGSKQPTFMSPGEQSAFAWLERRKRASPRSELHEDGPSAKNGRRLAPSKPDARRTAVTQAADMSHYAPPTGGAGEPEDVCAGAMPRGIMEPPSSDPGMTSFATLWDSSVGQSSVGQSSSDPHSSQRPSTPRDSIDFPRSPRDGRKSVFRRRAPALPPVGRARRVNRFSAAMVLFGTLSALAWALALTSGTQTSPSTAKDWHGQLAISEAKPQPRGAAEESPPAPVLAALPQQAANSDPISRSIRALQPAADEASDEATDESVTATRSATVSTDASMRARPDNAVAAIMVDSPGQLAITEAKPQPRGAAEASPSAPVLAALPQQAANPDPLSRSIRAPQPAAPDRLPDTRSLRSPVREKVIESDIPMPSEKHSTVGRAAAVSKRVLEQIFDEVASESPAPGNTGVDDDTPVGDIDAGGEVSALAIDESSEQAGNEATDEAVTATLSATVSTDVNMRARPDNAAAVIVVVPGKSDVEVIGCDDWCEVVFAGKRGWIYQRFIVAADSTVGVSGM